jgi:putative SOS response-associated peptidase YedK
MMHRYVLPQQRLAEHEFVPQQAWWKFRARFNVSPHQFVPCVRMHEGCTEASMMAWGLRVSAEEQMPNPDRPVLVASGQIRTLPGIREAWGRSRRCILPAAGFYVWRPMAAGHRQPYYVCLADRMVFGIAGIWDCWSDRSGDVMESCCAVSVPPNAFMQRLLPVEPAMPAILRRRDYASWLGEDESAALAALQPYDSGSMEACAVSPRVNSPRAEGRSLIRPIRLSA